jgi:hypothetical protein
MPRSPQPTIKTCGELTETSLTDYDDSIMPFHLGYCVIANR